VVKKIVWLSLSVLVITLGGVGYAQIGAEGKKLYATYCVGHHGDQGKGDGAAASALPVKPANLTDGTVMNQLPDKFLAEIISKGGGGGRQVPRHARIGKSI
jgi:mono/diheme cytochrome c family protein